MYLAYVWSTRGPSPQKWLEIPTDGSGRPKRALAMHKLKQNEEMMSLNELQELYPPPKVDSDGIR